MKIKILLVLSLLTASVVANSSVAVVGAFDYGTFTETIFINTDAEKDVYCGFRSGEFKLRFMVEKDSTYSLMLPANVKGVISCRYYGN